MPPSEPRRPFDWRGWLILAWALWFGLLYARMIIETRGQKIRHFLPVAGKP